MGRASIAILLALAATAAQAELKALDDEELSSVDGAGIGFVLDKVLLDASNATITLNDINNGSGQNVPISVKEFYLGAIGSNNGANLNAVTIGRLDHPFALNLARGETLRTLNDAGQWVQTTPNGVSVLEFMFPERLTTGGSACISGYSTGGNTCSSRASEKVDLGIRFDFQVAAGRTDVLNLDISELAMDGSYLRLWGDKAKSQMVGEMRINLFAKSIQLMSCAAGSANCTTAEQQRDRTIFMSGAYATVALGYGKSQPLLFDVSSNGQFVLELQNPTASGTTTAQKQALADDFYANAPRTSIIINNLKVGTGNFSSGGYNFGYNEIGGLSINYLKVTSHDL